MSSDTSRPIRRPAAGGGFVFRFDRYTFDSARNELYVDGIGVKLEPRPREVLTLLLRHAGEVVTKAELLDQIWAQSDISEQVVPNAIAKLRRALGTETAARIVTVSRYGYRFDGPVERIATGRSTVTRLMLEQGQAVPERPAWRLKRQIGSGIAEVWLATDKDGEQRVYKFCPDGAQLPAFKREVTILRLLEQSLGQQDAFVHLIGWNLSTEPFFLELEYAGPDLLSWAEQEQRLQQLTQDQRIALFLQIADAVASAHQLGILHKDLKPKNVLIRDGNSSTPIAKVADFGSSDLLEPHRLDALDITRMGLTISDESHQRSYQTGTPLYLAPELFSHRPPTVRSDIYALGVMLYQILAGNLRQPLPADWRRHISDPLLQEDIALATASDPDQRLSGIGELCERLRTRTQRAQARQAQEHQQQRAEAAERALERNRIRRPWLITAALTLLAGIATSLLLLNNAIQAQNTAIRERARADSINRFLIDDLLASGMQHDQAYENDPTMREVLQRAATRLDQRFETQPLVESDIALTLGGAFLTLGRYPEAEAMYRRAAHSSTEALGVRHPHSLKAQYRLSQVLADQARYEEAGAVLDRTDAMAVGLTDTELAIEAADARSTYFFQQLKVADALPQFERLESLLAQTGDTDPRRRFNAANGVAQCLLRLSRYAEAEAQLTALMNDPRFSAEMIGSRAGLVKVNLGRAIRAQGRVTEALDLIRDGQAQMEQARGTDDYLVITALGVLAQTYADLGDTTQALAIYWQVYQRMVAAFGEDNERTLAQLINVGINQGETGQIAAAVASLLQAEATLTRRYGADNVMTQSARYFLAMMYARSKTPERGLLLLDGLNPDALQAATAGVGLAAKLQALRGQLLLLSGQTEAGRSTLHDAIIAMEQAGVDADTIAPFRALLAHDGA